MKIIVFICVALAMVMGLAKPVSAISEVQKNAISENCTTIQDDLKTLQHNDSRTRVYLGRYYETILTDFIMPLNERLKENMLLDDYFADNQNDFARMRANFIIDYIEYQKALEELARTDCKREPERFYRKLVGVREKRQIVADDTKKIGKLMLAQVSLVEDLRSRL